MHPVLVVDDHLDVVEAIGLYLRFHGHDAVTATDGQQALDLLRQGLRPCVIVLDLMMPEMDGFSFRAEQLADRTLADIPVIVCSAAFDAGPAAQRLQAAAFLPKPTEMKALLELIRQHCAPAVTPPC
jgi:two-component system response regulator MprA